MTIKVSLMQNLSLIAYLVLEIWRHKISLGRRERVMKFGYLPPENGLNFKKMSLYVQNRSSRPKIDPSCQFQQFSSTGKISHFQNFWDVSMRKEQQQPPWLTNFAKMWPNSVSRIKTKSHQVWASLDKRFLIGSCEFGHPGLWAPPPGPDRVNLASVCMRSVHFGFIWIRSTLARVRFNCAVFHPPRGTLPPWNHTVPNWITFKSEAIRYRIGEPI